MLLKEITDLRGPSGWENAARDAIRREAERLLAGRDAQIFTDTMGNLYAIRRGTNASKKRVMLCAHMDEVGFIIRCATEDGLLRFASVGGIEAYVMPAARVLVGENAVPGVIGMKAVHLMSDEEESSPIKADQLSIDIGAKDKEEAERLCPPGSYATFDSEYRLFGDGFVKAKALDDRVGCMILLDALEKSAYSGDLCCVFTVQEEVGLRGATVAARRVNPDVAIILEGTVCNDMGKTPSHERVTECGMGAVIAVMDKRMIADGALRRRAMEVAKARGIPAQLKRVPVGGTDAGAIHISGAGVPCLVLAAPCRYIHSASSVAKLQDIDAVRDLTLAMLEDMDSGDEKEEIIP